VSIGDQSGGSFPAGPRDPQLIVLRAVCDALHPDFSLPDAAARIAAYAGGDADLLRRAERRLRASAPGTASAVARRALATLARAIGEIDAAGH